VPTAWARDALALLAEDRAAEPATPLRRFPLPADWRIELFVKDETRRPTGSMKHGFARALLVDALVGERIGEGTPLVEATSGNMAVAQAYFAQRLGLPFTAVVPSRTSAAKVARIEAYGGTCLRVDPPLAVYDRARALAASTGGHYLDHLANIGAAVDAQAPVGLAAELPDDLAWVVLGVGSGAGSRAVGRHLREYPTRVAVVDPENSAYFPGWATDSVDYGTGMPSRIEGIGRPRIEPAFDGDVVDLVIPVPDATSVAAMRYLAAVTGVVAGPSTGACLWGAGQVIRRMRADGVAGTVVFVAGDAGESYADTYYDDLWVGAKGWDLAEPMAEVAHLLGG
jgi:cysteine synthase A